MNIWRSAQEWQVKSLTGRPDIAFKVGCKAIWVATRVDALVPVWGWVYFLLSMRLSASWVLWRNRGIYLGWMLLAK